MPQGKALGRGHQRQRDKGDRIQVPELIALPFSYLQNNLKLKSPSW